jgi:hypothetical protein
MGASEKASSPAALMVDGGGWLGRARERRGGYRAGGVPRRLLGSCVAYRS